MEVNVCTWSLFHGRAEPAVHADLSGAFAAALGQRPWDVAGLQEVPPWWAGALGQALGASVRTTRTSFLRALLPRCQRRVHSADPERIGVRGAGANVLLVRPSAGRITDHRAATLRWLPQRRSVHAVRIVPPAAGPSGRNEGDGAYWVANVHTHNRPAVAAERDLRRALAVAEGWAGGEPLVLLGDLNLSRETTAAATRRSGWALLHGHRVDHVLGRSGAEGATGTYAEVARLAPGVTLADHRLVGLCVNIPDLGPRAVPDRGTLPPS